MNPDDSTVPVSARPSVCWESTLDPDPHKEVVGFVATYRELVTLVKQTYFEYLHVGWGCFLSGCNAPSWDLQIQSRLGKMAAFLPEQEYNRIIDEAFAEFGRQVDPTLWDIYLHGDEFDQRAVCVVMNEAHDRKRPLGMKALVNLIRKLATRERGNSGTLT
jgi:hypothetical protein